MTPFLVATLLALLAGGALALIWREHRALFPRAVAIALTITAVVAGYAWWVSHGYALVGDAGQVTLSGLKLEPVAGSYRLQGMARNTSSELAVSAVPVRLQVADCPAATKTDACRALFDLTQPLLVSIPPGESRAFVLVFSPPPLTVGGTLQWQASAGAPRTNQPVVR